MIKTLTDRLYYWFCGLLLLTSPMLQAQDGTTLGTEFFFAFPQNYINDAEQYPEIFVSGKPGTRIEISQPASVKRPWHGTYKLNAQGYWGSGQLERGDVAAYGHERNPLGIYLKASDTVSVYINSLRAYSADGTVVLPIASLGKEYYVSAYKEFVPPYSSESQILIVAVEDSTNVMVWPAGLTKNLAMGPLEPNDPIRPSHIIRLRRGEVFQIQGAVSGNYGGGDLTGTRIVSFAPNGQRCKPIAVFGGNACTNVGITDGCGGYCDVVFDQAYPVSAWGKEFVGVPLANRTMDRYRILGSEDSTLLYVNGSRNPLRDARGNIVYLNQGKFYQYDHATGSAKSGPTKRPFQLKTSKPVAVTQYCASRTCGVSLDNKGDPFAIELSPNEQRITKMLFNVFEIKQGDPQKVYTANILALREDIGKVTYDGRPISLDNFYRGTDLFTSDAQPKGLTYAIITGVTPGTHTIEAPGGFVGTVYEMATDESYGYAMGAKLAPLNFKHSFLDGDYPTIKVELSPDSICAGVDVIFTLNDRNGRFKFFTWDFGDGTKFFPTADKNRERGDTVRHTYNRSGTFFITVGAAKNLKTDICDNLVEYKIRLEIKPRPFQGGALRGPASVCPNQKNVRYWTANIKRTPYRKYIWEITGRGDPDSVGIVTMVNGRKKLVKQLITTDSAIFVDWHLPDNLAEVRVRGVEPGDCLSDFIRPTLKVKVGRDSQVPADTLVGPYVVCPDARRAIYRASDKGERSSYSWKITPSTGFKIVRALDKDSSGLEIEWLPASYGKTYTLDVKEIDSAIITCLPSIALPSFKTYIYPRADSVINFVSVSYPPAGQPDDHISVKYNLVNHIIDTVETVSYSKLEVSKRGIDPATNQTTTSFPALKSSDGNLRDTQIKPTEEVYEYSVSGLDNCPGGGTPIKPSRPLRSMLLKGEALAASEPSKPTISSLTWTPYINPPGSVEYWVHRKTENQDWKLYSTAPITGTSVSFENGDDAVFHYYKIEARITTPGGTKLSVWSNQTEIVHAKEVYGTPIMTPNGDGKNDALVIVNMRAHIVVGPKKLTIYNRWGQIVRTIDDYQNDWSGTGPNGEQLEGTYYYIVTDVEGGLVTKGAVTILR